jgi:hypothetical protein
LKITVAFKTEMALKMWKKLHVVIDFHFSVNVYDDPEDIYTVDAWKTKNLSSIC